MEENKAKGVLVRKPVIARALRGVPAVVAVFEIHLPRGCGLERVLLRGAVAGEAKLAHLPQQTALEACLWQMSVAGEFHEGDFSARFAWSK